MTPNKKTILTLALAGFFLFPLISCDVLLAPMPTQSYTAGPPASCTDVEFLGLYSQDGGIGIKIYTAKIRNKSSYTKNVTVEFLDMYGQSQKKNFDIKGGEMIDGQLAVLRTSDRKPLNTKLVSCY